MKPYNKSITWYRWFWLQLVGSEMDRMLILSMLFSTLLAVVRVGYTGSLIFLWLVWNLFLAWVPYMITSWLQQRPAVTNSKWKFATIAFVWLLFVPNSFYILTDLFHLGPRKEVPLWFDLSLIISFAWNGLLLGMLSVWQMEKMMQRYLKGKHELLFIYPIMWLNALGVYIGRYLRFNSWDIITNPFKLTADILNMLIHPLHYKYAWGMVACFSVFITLAYITIKRIGKTIQ
jgi:uncharacterized membrane protein